MLLLLCPFQAPSVADEVDGQAEAQHAHPQQPDVDLAGERARAVRAAGEGWLSRVAWRDSSVRSCLLCLKAPLPFPSLPWHRGPQVPSSPGGPTDCLLTQSAKHATCGAKPGTTLSRGGSHPEREARALATLAQFQQLFATRGPGSLAAQPPPRSQIMGCLCVFCSCGGKRKMA